MISTSLFGPAALRRYLCPVAAALIIAAGTRATGLKEPAQPPAAAAQARRAKPVERVNASSSAVDVRPTVRPGALIPLERKRVIIRGSAPGSVGARVLVRVTTGTGSTVQAAFPVRDGAFAANYPADFPGAPRWQPGVLYVDATDRASFRPSASGRDAAEITLLIFDPGRRIVPDIPSAFTTDLLDRQGRRDRASAEWPATRALVNLYIRSYGAHLTGAGRSDFDLDRPADFDYFRGSLALYDFDLRDRDWTKRPAGHRVARTFWKSVWSTWFNASNDNPLDGNPGNSAHSNYTPYVFTNDFADVLIEHLLRRGLANSSEDNLDTMCREGAENLLAWQHHGSTNFALRAANGRREQYTAGAFHYGLFINGDFMTEGTGWFANPNFRDYADGGVLNGRALWAIGEALRSERDVKFSERLKQALALGVRFCLHDALPPGYAKQTKSGRVYWRDAGEHAYLSLGMVNGCAAAPDLIVLHPDGRAPKTLREATAEALNALVDLESPEGQWAVYPNVDSVAISALAEGARVLKNSPDSARWRAAAVKAADGWLRARVDPAEFKGPVVHFGLRLTPDTMTYRWSRLDPRSWKNHNYLFFYQTGHWIDALARLYALTGDARYRNRAEQMVSYLCGDNPWGVRLLNELGGVYNWVEDENVDGIEDTLRQDMYPESTAFTRIGLNNLMKSIAGAP